MADHADDPAAWCLDGHPGLVYRDAVMAEVLKIRFGEEPSPFTDHVLVEETQPGIFRVSGVLNRNGAPEYFSPPQSDAIDVVLEVASTWADEQGIQYVHLAMPHL